MPRLAALPQEMTCGGYEGKVTLVDFDARGRYMASAGGERNIGALGLAELFWWARCGACQPASADLPWPAHKGVCVPLSTPRQGGC